jgi:hypothetical protein
MTMTEPIEFDEVQQPKRARLSVQDRGTGVFLRYATPDDLRKAGWVPASEAGTSDSTVDELWNIIGPLGLSRTLRGAVKTLIAERDELREKLALVISERDKLAEARVKAERTATEAVLAFQAVEHERDAMRAVVEAAAAAYDFYVSHLGIRQWAAFENLKAAVLEWRKVRDGGTK